MICEVKERFDRFDSDLRDSTKLNILYLDDDPMDHKLMKLFLRRSEGADNCDLTCVLNIAEARERLGAGGVDILVLDNRMPESPNFQVTLEKLGAIDDRTKLVVVSSEVEGEAFRKIDNPAHKPVAILEKSTLRSRVCDGFFETL
jgi:CheY-like chemotaxis protein